MKDLLLGDWCKWLEKNFSNEIMIPTLPVIIRLDGNNFSKWTKGLEKPYDPSLVELMIDVTKYLVNETGAVIGYTQSDEITLILYSNNRHSDIYHAGKKQKIVSKLAAKCTAYFNDKRLEFLPNHNADNAIFDCRVYQTPTLQDACAQLIWRENDATRNSILNLGYAYFSHDELFKLSTSEIVEKLQGIGVIWSNLPEHIQRGTYVKKFKINQKFTPEEFNKLPEKHEAKLSSNLTIERTIIKSYTNPPLNWIENLIEVIFNGAEPKYLQL